MRAGAYCRFRIRISPGEAQPEAGRLTSGDGHGEGNKACYLTANRSELPVVLEPRWWQFCLWRECAPEHHDGFGVLQHGSDSGSC